VNWFRMYRSRHYLKKLLITIAIALVAIVITVSGVMYYGAERAMVDLNSQGNQKVLSQLKYNIDYINDNLKRAVMTLYFDNNNYPLLHAEHIETITMLSKLRNLNLFVDSSPFLHSIVMYNPIQKQYYTGGQMEMSIKDDKLLSRLDHYLDENRNIPKMHLIPMSIVENEGMDDQKVDVFSMFVYDGINGYTKNQSILIINIKPEWLFDNLNLLNGIIGNESGTIAVMDNNYSMFYPTIENRPLNNDFKIRILQRMPSDSESGSFIESDEGEKHLVTFMSTGLNEWKLIIVQPYRTLLEPINDLKLMELVIILCFVLFAIVCSIIVSLRLYRPIQQLLGQLMPASLCEHNRLSAESMKMENELHYIGDTYNNMHTRLQSIKQDQDENQTIVKSYYTRMLLLESRSLSRTDFELLADKQQLHVVSHGYFRLCALQIDHASSFHQTFSTTDQKLLRFAIRNIAEHICSATYHVETMEAKGDLTVLLISSEQLPTDSAIISLLSEVQKAVRHYYRLSLTVTLGQSVHDYRELSGIYTELLEMTGYRMISGHGSVITSELVNRNKSSDNVKVMDDLEKRFVEAIKMNHTEQMEEHLSTMFLYLQTLPYDRLILSLLNTMTMVRHAISEINANGLHTIHIGWNGFIREITELETLEEARNLFKQLFEEITDKQIDGHLDKHRVLVETIKEMIEARYSDLNLSLQTIADLLGMKTSYVSRIFRKVKPFSVHDYIREVRLKHALRLLEESDKPISDIMEKVGYGNVSNFFRHFKSNYGTTPKDYRLKRSIDH
jgi:AraC-like DNA-binding protein